MIVFLLIVLGFFSLYFWFFIKINRPPQILYYTEAQNVEGYIVFSSNREHSNDVLKVDVKKMRKNGTKFQRVSKEVWIVMRGERIIWYV